MAQIVEADIRQTGSLKHGLEGAMKVARFKPATDTRRENETFILPARARSKAFLELADAMSL